MHIRDATVEDLPAIVDLWNSLIRTTTVAWTEELDTLQRRAAWFAEKQRRGHPVLVAEERDAVVGYSCYGDFRDTVRFPGYLQTVEHTIHVRGDHHGRGIGRELVEELLRRARTNGIHVVVAAVDAENDASIRFHERLGFVEVARMPEVGRKFGRWLDLVLLQRIVDA